MERQQRLHKKISKALRAAGVPRWIQRFGPKKSTTEELVLGLVVRARWARSYREAARFLDEYYGVVLHWTTLQKAAARLPMWVWHAVLRLTARVESMLAAIDSTGFSTTNPSAHYVRRIDGITPKTPVKLSIMVDVESRHVLSARVRVRPAHDVRDVPGLLRNAYQIPWSIVMDKAYDSEPLHEWLDKKGVWSIAPTRKQCRRGRHRLQLRDAFPEQEYSYRNIVENTLGNIKQRFGGSVSCRKASTIRAELMLRLILHNINHIIYRLFLQRRPYR